MKTNNIYSSNTSNSNKKIRTLNQTLSFLESLNKNYGRPFQRQDFNINNNITNTNNNNNNANVNNNNYIDDSKKKLKRPSNNYQFNLNQSSFNSTNKKLLRQQQQNNERKKMNKNRAIKRIMITSLQILQTSYQKPQTTYPTLSSITQLHIYLKQYNRLLDRITTKEKQIQNQLKHITQKQEDVLQNVYQYSVNQDYRDIVESAFLKDKISKETFQIMLQAFRKSLIIIKGNQFKVFQTQQQDSRFRLFKLVQIQNVDYHSQPYIFTVFTFIKDKSKQNQYLYLKFSSQYNQNKWDRAVYSSYMARKMKIKRKMFQKQYPPQKKQINISVIDPKRQNYISYDINQNKVLNKVQIEEDDKQYSQQNYLKSEKALMNNNQNRSRKGSFVDEQSSPIFKNTSNLFQNFHGLNSHHNQQKQQQKISDNSVVSVYSNYLSRQKNYNENKSLSNSNINNNNNGPHHNLKANKDKVMSMNDNIFLSPTNKSGFKKQKSDGQQDLGNNSSSLIKPNNQGMKDNFNNNKNLDTQNIIGQETFSQLIQSKQDAKSQQQNDRYSSMSRKNQIQQKYSEGLSVKKQKFLFNKAKRVFLKDKQIQYWDYDQSNKSKSQKKTIKVSFISQSKIKQNALQISHQNGKNISFIGSPTQIKEIEEWIKLAKQDIKNTLMKKPPNTQKKVRQQRPENLFLSMTQSKIN